jgi:hypothetical protein
MNTSAAIDDADSSEMGETGEKSVAGVASHREDRTLSPSLLIVTVTGRLHYG